MMGQYVTFRKTSVLFTSVVIAVCFGTTAAAPLQQNATRFPRDKGCYYLSTHYNNGERIDTNEPCLNCTCVNSMLMCYLRICPFVKPVGEDCIIERHEGDCCPKIWCPEVIPPKCSDPAGGPHAHEPPGCYLDGQYYADGAQLPRDVRKPCEVCYCIRNSTACVMQECELKVEGCTPVYRDGQCCPCRYNCTYEEATTAPPGVTLDELAEGCTTEGGLKISDGEAVNSTNPCEHCYCMRNEIVCAIQECQAPDDGCKPVPTKKDQCCPDRYDCPVLSTTDQTTDLSKTTEFQTSKTTLTFASVFSTPSTEAEERYTTSVDTQERVSEDVITTEVSGETTKPTAKTTLPTGVTRTAAEEMATHTESLEPRQPAVTDMGLTVTPKPFEVADQKLESTVPDATAVTDKETRKATFETTSATPEYTTSRTTVRIPARPMLRPGAIPGERRRPTTFTESEVSITTSKPPPRKPGRPIITSIPGEGTCRVGQAVFRNGETVNSTNPCKANCQCINSVIFCDDITCETPPKDVSGCKIIQIPTVCCPQYECEVEGPPETASVNLTKEHDVTEFASTTSAGSTSSTPLTVSTASEIPATAKTTLIEEEAPKSIVSSIDEGETILTTSSISGDVEMTTSAAPEEMERETSKSFIQTSEKEIEISTVPVITRNKTVPTSTLSVKEQPASTKVSLSEGTTSTYFIASEETVKEVLTDSTPTFEKDQKSTDEAHVAKEEDISTSTILLKDERTSTISPFPYDETFPTSSVSQEAATELLTTIGATSSKETEIPSKSPATEEEHIAISTSSFPEGTTYDEVAEETSTPYHEISEKEELSFEHPATKADITVSWTSTVKGEKISTVTTMPSDREEFSTFSESQEAGKEAEVTFVTLPKEEITTESPETKDVILTFTPSTEVERPTTPSISDVTKSTTFAASEEAGKDLLTAHTTISGEEISSVSSTFTGEDDTFTTVVHEGTSTTSSASDDKETTTFSVIQEEEKETSKPPVIQEHEKEITTPSEFQEEEKEKLKTTPPVIKEEEKEKETTIPSVTQEEEKEKETTTSPVIQEEEEKETTTSPVIQEEEKETTTSPVIQEEGKESTISPVIHEEEKERETTAPSVTYEEEKETRPSVIQEEEKEKTTPSVMEEEEKEKRTTAFYVTLEEGKEKATTAVVKAEEQTPSEPSTLKGEDIFASTPTITHETFSSEVSVSDGKRTTGFGETHETEKELLTTSVTRSEKEEVITTKSSEVTEGSSPWTASETTKSTVPQEEYIGTSTAFVTTSEKAEFSSEVPTIKDEHVPTSTVSQEQELTTVSTSAESDKEPSTTSEITKKEVPSESFATEVEDLLTSTPSVKDQKVSTIFPVSTEEGPTTIIAPRETETEKSTASSEIPEKEEETTFESQTTREELSSFSPVRDERISTVSSVSDGTKPTFAVSLTPQEATSATSVTEETSRTEPTLIKGESTLTSTPLVRDQKIPPTPSISDSKESTTLIVSLETEKEISTSITTKSEEQITSESPEIKTEGVITSTSSFKEERISSSSFITDGKESTTVVYQEAETELSTAAATTSEEIQTAAEVLTTAREDITASISTRVPESISTISPVSTEKESTKYTLPHEEEAETSEIFSKPTSAAETLSETVGTESGVTSILTSSVKSESTATTSETGIETAPEVGTTEHEGTTSYLPAVTETGKPSAPVDYSTEKAVHATYPELYDKTTTESIIPEESGKPSTTVPPIKELDITLTTARSSEETSVDDFGITTMKEFSSVSTFHPTVSLEKTSPVSKTESSPSPTEQKTAITETSSTIMPTEEKTFSFEATSSTAMGEKPVQESTTSKERFTFLEETTSTPVMKTSETAKLSISVTPAAATTPRTPTSVIQEESTYTEEQRVSTTSETPSTVDKETSKKLIILTTDEQIVTTGTVSEEQNQTTVTVSSSVVSTVKTEAFTLDNITTPVTFTVVEQTTSEPSLLDTKGTERPISIVTEFRETETPIHVTGSSTEAAAASTGTQPTIKAAVSTISDEEKGTATSESLDVGELTASTKEFAAATATATSTTEERVTTVSSTLEEISVTDKATFTTVPRDVTQKDTTVYTLGSSPPIKTTQAHTGKVYEAETTVAITSQITDRSTESSITSAKTEQTKTSFFTTTEESRPHTETLITTKEAASFPGDTPKTSTPEKKHVTPPETDISTKPEIAASSSVSTTERLETLSTAQEAETESRTLFKLTTLSSDETSATQEISNVSDTTVSPKFRESEETTVAPIQTTRSYEEITDRHRVTEQTRTTETLQYTELTTVKYEPAVGVEDFDCDFNGTVFKDGEKVTSLDPCELCYCALGQIACDLIICKPAPSSCVLLKPKEGECCSDVVECVKEDGTTTTVSLSQTTPLDDGYDHTQSTYAERSIIPVTYERRPEEHETATDIRAEVTTETQEPEGTSFGAVTRTTVIPGDLSTAHTLSSTTKVPGDKIETTTSFVSTSPSRDEIVSADTTISSTEEEISTPLVEMSTVSKGTVYSEPASDTKVPYELGTSPETTITAKVPLITEVETFDTSPEKTESSTSVSPSSLAPVTHMEIDTDTQKAEVSPVSAEVTTSRDMEKEIQVTEKVTAETETAGAETEKGDAITEKATLVTEKATLVTEIGTLVTDKEELTTEKSTLVTEKETLATDKELITEKEATITEKEATVTERTTLVTEKETVVTAKDALVTEKDTTVTEEEALVTEKDTVVIEKKTSAAAKETAVTEKQPTSTVKGIPVTKEETPATETSIVSFTESRRPIPIDSIYKETSATSFSTETSYLTTEQIETTKTDHTETPKQTVISLTVEKEDRVSAIIDVTKTTTEISTEKPAFTSKTTATVAEKDFPGSIPDTTQKVSTVVARTKITPSAEVLDETTSTKMSSVTYDDSSASIEPEVTDKVTYGTDKDIEEASSSLVTEVPKILTTTTTKPTITETTKLKQTAVETTLDDTKRETMSTASLVPASVQQKTTTPHATFTTGYSPSVELKRTSPHEGVTETITTLSTGVDLSTKLDGRPFSTSEISEGVTEEVTTEASSLSTTKGILIHVESTTPVLVQDVSTPRETKITSYPTASYTHSTKALSTATSSETEDTYEATSESEAVSELTEQAQTTESYKPTTITKLVSTSVDVKDVYTDSTETSTEQEETSSFLPVHLTVTASVGLDGVSTELEQEKTSLTTVTSEEASDVSSTAIPKETPTVRPQEFTISTKQTEMSLEEGTTQMASETPTEIKEKTTIIFTTLTSTETEEKVTELTTESPVTISTVMPTLVIQISSKTTEIDKELSTGEEVRSTHHITTEKGLETTKWDSKTSYDSTLHSEILTTPSGGSSISSEMAKPTTTAKSDVPYVSTTGKSTASAEVDTETERVSTEIGTPNFTSSTTETVQKTTKYPALPTGTATEGTTVDKEAELSTITRAKELFTTVELTTLVTPSGEAEQVTSQLYPEVTGSSVPASESPASVEVFTDKVSTATSEYVTESPVTTEISSRQTTFSEEHTTQDTEATSLGKITEPEETFGEETKSTEYISGTIKSSTETLPESVTTAGERISEFTSSPTGFPTEPRVHITSTSKEHGEETTTSTHVSRVTTEVATEHSVTKPTVQSKSTEVSPESTTIPEETFTEKSVDDKGITLIPKESTLKLETTSESPRVTLSEDFSSKATVHVSSVSDLSTESAVLPDEQTTTVEVPSTFKEDFSMRPTPFDDASKMPTFADTSIASMVPGVSTESFAATESKEISATVTTVRTKLPDGVPSETVEEDKVSTILTTLEAEVSTEVSSSDGFSTAQVTSAKISTEEKTIEEVQSTSASTTQKTELPEIKTTEPAKITTGLVTSEDLDTGSPSVFSELSTVSEETSPGPTKSTYAAVSSSDDTTIYEKYTTSVKGLSPELSSQIPEHSTKPEVTYAEITSASTLEPFDSSVPQKQMTYTKESPEQENVTVITLPEGEISTYGVTDETKFTAFQTTMFPSEQNKTRLDLTTERGTDYTAEPKTVTSDISFSETLTPSASTFRTSEEETKEPFIISTKPTTEELLPPRVTDSGKPASEPLTEIPEDFTKESAESVYDVTTSTTTITEEGTKETEFYPGRVTVKQVETTFEDTTVSDELKTKLTTKFKDVPKETEKITTEFSTQKLDTESYTTSKPTTTTLSTVPSKTSFVGEISSESTLASETSTKEETGPYSEHTSGILAEESTTVSEEKIPTLKTSTLFEYVTGPTTVRAYVPYRSSTSKHTATDFGTEEEATSIFTTSPETGSPKSSPVVGLQTSTESGQPEKETQPSESSPEPPASEQVTTEMYSTTTYSDVSKVTKADEAVEQSERTTMYSEVTLHTSSTASEPPASKVTTMSVQSSPETTVTTSTQTKTEISEAEITSQLTTLSEELATEGKDVYTSETSSQKTQTYVSTEHTTISGTTSTEVSSVKYDSSLKPQELEKDFFTESSASTVASVTEPAATEISIGSVVAAATTQATDTHLISETAKTSTHIPSEQVTLKEVISTGSTLQPSDISSQETTVLSTTFTGAKETSTTVTSEPSPKVISQETTTSETLYEKSTPLKEISSETVAESEETTVLPVTLTTESRAQVSTVTTKSQYDVTETATKVSMKPSTHSSDVTFSERPTTTGLEFSQESSTQSTVTSTKFSSESDEITSKLPIITTRLTDEGSSSTVEAHVTVTELSDTTQESTTYPTEVSTMDTDTYSYFPKKSTVHKITTQSTSTAKEIASESDTLPSETPSQSYDSFPISTPARIPSIKTVAPSDTSLQPTTFETTDSEKLATEISSTLITSPGSTVHVTELEVFTTESSTSTEYVSEMLSTAVSDHKKASTLGPDYISKDYTSTKGIESERAFETTLKPTYTTTLKTTEKGTVLFETSTAAKIPTVDYESKITTATPESADASARPSSTGSTPRETKNDTFLTVTEPTSKSPATYDDLTSSTGTPSHVFTVSKAAAETESTERITKTTREDYSTAVPLVTPDGKESAPKLFDGTTVIEVEPVTVEEETPSVSDASETPTEKRASELPYTTEKSITEFMIAQDVSETEPQVKLPKSSTTEKPEILMPTSSTTLGETADTTVSTPDERIEDLGETSESSLPSEYSTVMPGTSTDGVELTSEKQAASETEEAFTFDLETKLSTQSEYPTEKSKPTELQYEPTSKHPEPTSLSLEDVTMTGSVQISTVSEPTTAQISTTESVLVEKTTLGSKPSVSEEQEQTVLGTVTTSRPTKIEEATITGLSIETESTPSKLATTSGVTVSTLHPTKSEATTITQDTPTSTESTQIYEESSQPEEKVGLTDTSSQEITVPTTSSFTKISAEAGDVMKITKPVHETYAPTTKETAAGTYSSLKTTIATIVTEKETASTEVEPEVIFTENVTGKPPQIDSVLKDTTSVPPSSAEVFTKTSAPSDRRITEETENVTTRISEEFTTEGPTTYVPSITTGIDHKIMVTMTGSSTHVTLSSPAAKETESHEGRLTTQAISSEIPRITTYTEMSKDTDFTGEFSTTRFETTEHPEYASSEATMFTETQMVDSSTKEEVKPKDETEAYTQTSFSRSTVRAETEKYSTPESPEYPTAPSQTTKAEIKHIKTTERPLHSVTESEATSEYASPEAVTTEKPASTTTLISIKDTAEVTSSPFATDLPKSTDVSYPVETIQTKETETTLGEVTITEGTQRPPSDAYPKSTESVSVESEITERKTTEEISSTSTLSIKDTEKETVTLSPLPVSETATPGSPMSTVSWPWSSESTVVTAEKHPTFSSTFQYDTTVTTATPVAQYVTSRMKTTILPAGATEGQTSETTEIVTGDVTESFSEETDITSDRSITRPKESLFTAGLTSPSDSGDRTAESTDGVTKVTDSKGFVSDVTDVQHPESEKSTPTTVEPLEQTRATKAEIPVSAISVSDVTSLRPETSTSSITTITEMKPSSLSGVDLERTKEVTTSTGTSDITIKYEIDQTTVRFDAETAKYTRTAATSTDTYTSTENVDVGIKTKVSVSDEEEVLSSSVSTVSDTTEYSSTGSSSVKETETSFTSIPTEKRLTEEISTQATGEGEVTTSEGTTVTASEITTERGVTKEKGLPSTSTITESHITDETQVTHITEEFTSLQETPSSTYETEEEVTESKMSTFVTEGNTTSTAPEGKVTTLTSADVSTESSVAKAEYTTGSTPKVTETTVKVSEEFSSITELDTTASYASPKTEITHEITEPTTYYEEDLVAKTSFKTTVAPSDKTETATYATGSTETSSTSKDLVESKETSSVSFVTTSSDMGITEEGMTTSTGEVPKDATEPDTTMTSTFSTPTVLDERFKGTVTFSEASTAYDKKITDALPVTSTSGTEHLEGTYTTTQKHIDVKDSTETLSTIVTEEAMFNATTSSLTIISKDEKSTPYQETSTAPTSKEVVSVQDITTTLVLNETYFTESSTVYTETENISLSESTGEPVTSVTSTEPHSEPAKVIEGKIEIVYTVPEEPSSTKPDVIYTKLQTEILPVSVHDTTFSGFHSESTLSEHTITSAVSLLPEDTPQRKETTTTLVTVPETRVTETVSYDSKSTEIRTGETTPTEEGKPSTDFMEANFTFTASPISETTHFSSTKFTEIEATDKSEHTLSSGAADQSKKDEGFVSHSTAPTQSQSETEVYGTVTASTGEASSTSFAVDTSKQTTVYPLKELTTSSDTYPTSSEESTESTDYYKTTTSKAETFEETEISTEVTEKAEEETATYLSKLLTSATEGSIPMSTVERKDDTEDTTSRPEATVTTTSSDEFTSHTSKAEEVASPISTVEGRESTTSGTDLATLRAEDATATKSSEKPALPASTAKDTIPISSTLQETSSTSPRAEFTTVTLISEATSPAASTENATVSREEDMTSTASGVEDITLTISSHEEAHLSQAVTVPEVIHTRTTEKETNATDVSPATEEGISFSSVKDVPITQKTTQPDSEVITLHDVKISTPLGSTDFVFTGSPSMISTLQEKLSTPDYATTSGPTSSDTESTTSRSTIDEIVEKLSTLFMPTRNVTAATTTTKSLPTTTEKTEHTEFTEPPYLPPEEGYCFFDGQIYQSAEQIPRADPCEFCFCFRGDIICLQQTCPPPIRGCYATPIEGFCCPRFQCPVHTKRMNITTTTTTTTTHRPKYGGSPLSQKTISVTGCEIDGTFYRVGQLVRPASGPCIECRCEFGGMMKCNPQDCQPQEPLLLRMNKEFFRKKR